MAEKQEVDFMHPFFSASGCDVGVEPTDSPIGCTVGLTDYLNNRRSTAADGLDVGCSQPSSNCNFYKTRTKSMDNLNSTISEVVISENNLMANNPCEVLRKSFNSLAISNDAVCTQKTVKTATTENKKFYSSQTSNEWTTSQSSQTEQFGKSSQHQISSQDSSHSTTVYKKSSTQSHLKESSSQNTTLCLRSDNSASDKFFRRSPADVFKDMREPQEGILSTDSGIEDSYETPVQYRITASPESASNQSILQSPIRKDNTVVLPVVRGTQPASNQSILQSPVRNDNTIVLPVVRGTQPASNQSILQSPVRNDNSVVLPVVRGTQPALSSFVEYSEVRELPSQSTVLSPHRNTLPLTIQNDCSQKGPRLPKRPNTNIQEDDPSFAEYCEIDELETDDAKRERLQQEKYMDYRGYDAVEKTETAPKLPAPNQGQMIEHQQEVSSGSPNKTKDVSRMIEVYVLAVSVHETKEKGELKLIPGMRIKQKEHADSNGFAYGWTKSRFGKKKYGRYPVDKVIHLPRVT